MSEPPLKRRTVRKGTRNCWECKRRKVRCVSTSPTGATCDNCTQRRTPCVRQEYEQETVLPSMHGGIDARLVRVEQLLQQVLDRGTSAGTSGALHREALTTSPHGTHDELYRGHENALPTPSTTTCAFSDSPPLEAQYEGTARRLIALWPGEVEIAHLYDLPASLSTHLQMRAFSTSPGTQLHDVPTVHDMLELPPPGSHIILIAHKLLILAGLLQGALAITDLPVERQRRFESRALSITDAVARLATSDDNLTSSIEGVECIMMEAMIQNHAGKLHHAWRTVRRAVTVGQILGLHRSAPIPPERFLDTESRRYFDVEKFCFHMVSMDRYLSTTLGLPYASNLPYAKTPERLTTFAPIDRMARLQCVIAERLLERPKDDLSGVAEIDRLLLEAAAQMPHAWWLTPELSYRPVNTVVDPDQDRMIARFNYQLSHYHLLLRLYLPCLFQPRCNADHSQGKRIALSASRDILLRYHAFRTWNQSRYYCRGMDFLALIALTVLCVVHIDAKAQQATSVAQISMSHELAHSRPVDRGMMQRTFELLQQSDHDDTASKLSGMMQSLLDIEIEATAGTQYSATVLYSGDGTTEYQSEVLDGGRQLRLRIPYFGTIMLQQHRHPDLVNSSSATHDCTITDELATFHTTGMDWCEVYLQETALCNDLTLQTVNQALFQDLFGGTSSF